MKKDIHTFLLELDMGLVNVLSNIDRFGGEWIAIEKREGQSLRQLKSIATVRSVGASTRIEGSGMTDDEVDIFLNRMDISKLTERDQQEVAGYYEALDLITQSFTDIPVSENSLKQLHAAGMKYSEKDVWHKGNYKQHSNRVEATNPDGTKHIVFQTTEPGFPTGEAMKKLVEWYRSADETHPIIRAALFVYDFLSIHPFQDGNGRLSRLITTLLLLQHGYSWVQYVSFEHEIENRKKEYYRVLMQCQRQRPGENVYPWIIFFTDCLKNMRDHLLKKLDVHEITTRMTQREKRIYSFIEAHPGCKSGEIARKLEVPLPTIKRILAEMHNSGTISKYGIGAGTNYVVESTQSIKSGMTFTLSNTEGVKKFILPNSLAFIELRKIVLTPLFSYKEADDWSVKLTRNGLGFKVTISNKSGKTVSQIFSILAYNSPYHRQPVFTITRPIYIPGSFWDTAIGKDEYPLYAEIELTGSSDQIDFDATFIYDGNAGEGRE